jgi:colanic acid biosynthesis glycosyl transferase WcaI
VVALFAGTLGRKHGLAVLPALAQRLAAAVPPIHLVLCGRGPLREELVQGTAGLPRVHFLDLQPQGRMDELLGLADIHLLLQDPAAQDFVLPSKLAGMLASGRPVLATCDEGSELAAVVARCGERVAPGDPGALAASLLTLAQQPQRRAQLGAAARAIACAEFDREPVLGRLAAALRERTDGAA